METDEEVFIESETQEDSAFLDGEEQEDCYRALNREREAFRDSDQEYEDGNPELTTPEPSKEKKHPSKKLKDRFEEYLKELYVLGFISGNMA